MARANRKISPHDVSVAEPVATGSAARPVDLVHLSKYTLGDRDLEREVLQLFRCQSKIYIERLRAAREPKAAHDIAHTIKGSARSIGAWHVVECAETAETLSAEANGARMERAVAALDEAIREADGYINSLVGAD